MPGRPAKPNFLKLIDGNPGKTAINEHEPKPKGKLPRAASLLNADGKAEWKRIVEGMPKELYTQVDWAEILTICIMWQQFMEKFKEGSCPNPNLLSQWRGLRTSNGLNPSSRARLSTPPVDDKKDPAAEFFGT